MENFNYVINNQNQNRQQVSNSSSESGALDFAAFTTQAASECQKCYFHEAVYTHQQLGEICSKCQEYFGIENN